MLSKVQYLNYKFAINEIPWIILVQFKSKCGSYCKKNPPSIVLALFIPKQTAETARVLIRKF